MITTFVILTYNHEKYIKDCLTTVLSQDYCSGQVVIVDDCSKDNTASIVKEFLDENSLNESWFLIQNVTNKGHVCRLNEAVQNFPSDIYILGSGDDLFAKNRVSFLVDIFHTYKPSVVGSGYKKIPPTYLLPHPCPDIFQPTNATGPEKFRKFDQSSLKSESEHLLGATIAFSSVVFDTFGFLDDLVLYEDNILEFRGALISGSFYFEKELVLYRTHSEALTNNGVSLSPYSHQSKLLSLLRPNIVKLRQKITDIKKARQLSLVTPYRFVNIYLGLIFELCRNVSLVVCVKYLPFSFVLLPFHVLLFADLRALSLFLRLR